MNQTFGVGFDQIELVSASENVPVNVEPLEKVGYQIVDAFFVYVQILGLTGDVFKFPQNALFNLVKIAGDGLSVKQRVLLANEHKIVDHVSQIILSFNPVGEGVIDIFFQIVKKIFMGHLKFSERFESRFLEFFDT